MYHGNVCRHLLWKKLGATADKEKTGPGYHFHCFIHSRVFPISVSSECAVSVFHMNLTYFEGRDIREY